MGAIQNIRIDLRGGVVILRINPALSTQGPGPDSNLTPPTLLKTSLPVRLRALAAAAWVLLGSGVHAATVLELNPNVWLNAGSITGIANGDPLQSWADSSGNGRNATQGTLNRRPLYFATAGANSTPVLRFNTQLHSGGTANQFMSFATPLANTAASALTLFAVASDSGARTTGARATVVNTRTNSTTSNGFLFGYGATSGAEAYAHTGNSSPAGTTQTTAIAPSGFDLLTLERNGLNTKLSNFSDPATNGTSTTWNGFTVSTLTTTQIGTEGGIHYFFGDIAEIIAFERVLTPGETNDVVKYLGDKYSIATASAVPEPSVMGLLAGGALLLGKIRTRRRN